jgi:hypothetical protein
MNQSTRLKKLEDIERAMREEQGLRSLLAGLAKLENVAESTVDRNAVGAERMNELAGYMAEIRHLLGHLRPEQYHPAVAEESRSLAERYRDLEGKVKELRNDARPR